MFKDKEEALRRLEAELLREEEEEEASEAWEEDPDEAWEEEADEEEEAWDEDPDEEEEAWEEDADDEEEPQQAHGPRYRPQHVRAYNADRMDGDLEEYSRLVYESGSRSRGRWIAAAVLIVLAAVLLTLAFFAARYGG